MYGWVKFFMKKYWGTMLFVFAFFLSLPLEWGILQGFYLYLSPNIAINRLLAQHGLIIFHVFSFIILWICIRRKRWFCHTICPLGWSFQLLRSKNPRKNRAFDKIKVGEILALFSIGLSLGGISLFLIFDPLVVFRTFFSGWILPISICGVLWSSFYLLLLILNYFYPFLWCTNKRPGTRSMRVPMMEASTLVGSPR